MRIWGLKNCDTCRKAIKELGAAGRKLDVVDVRADGVEYADMQRFFDAFAGALVNKRSTTWRGLDEATRSGDPVQLMLAHPSLMKRPVIEDQGQLTLGWSAETRAQWLDKPA